MRWLLLIGVVLFVAVAMLTDSPGRKNQDVDAMMKRVRAAKARKAKQRHEAESEQNRAQMKAA